MALTAVITRPTISAGAEQFISGISRNVFSGMDSYLTTASPADAWDTISKWTWTFPDGQTKYGAIVQWSPTATCTAQNVTLTVEALVGGSVATASATVAVTVAAAPTWNVTKYTRSGGAEGGGHTGNTNVDGDAYQHLCEGFFEYSNNNLRDGSQGFATVGELALQNAGDSLLFGATPTSPRSGPTLITRVGGGANPLYTVVAGKEFELALDGATDGNSYSTPVWCDGVDFTWASVDPGNTILIDGHVGCIFSKGVITKSAIATRGNTFIVFNSTIQQGKNTGLSISAGADFCVADTCVIKTNGTLDSIHDAGPADHQLYGSDGVSNLGVVDCTLDQNGATAYSGEKHSGCSQVYSGRNTIKNCNVALDVGSNNDGNAEGTDYIYDGLILDTITLTGFYSNYCNRVSIRNCRAYAGCSTDLFRAQSYSTARFVRNVNLYCASANLITGLVGNFTGTDGGPDTSDPFTGVKVIGNAIVKANAGPFYSFRFTGDDAKTTIDYNVYWRVGGTPDADANFAVIQGVTKTWAQWKALGLDTHSYFRDPLFASGTDLHPQAGSPCIWDGATGGGTPLGSLTRDCADTLRSATHPTIGAFEVAGGNFAETADVGTFTLTGQDVAESAGGNFSEIMDQGTFTLSGQDVSESNTAQQISPRNRGDTLSSYGPSMKEVYIHRKPGLFK